MTTNQVIAALEQQVACYQRLAKLTEIQHEHVQRSQTEDLLRVLAQRQDVLDVVADLEQSIGPVKRRWTDYVAGLPPDERVRADSLLAETRRLLEQITSVDRNDALILQQRKLNLGREINHATAARKVNRTYAVSAYGARPASMDLKL